MTAGVSPERGIEAASGGSPDNQGQLRGSTALVLGRFFDLGINLLSQVLIVRYLTQADFGAFAYALAVVSIGSSFAAFGLDKATSRFLPIYEERGERGKVLGTLLLATITMLALGLAAIALFYLMAALGITLQEDATGVLLILVLLVPIQAIQPLLTAVFAAFSSTRAILFRAYILTPMLQLAVVGAVIFSGTSLAWLAAGWVAVGAVGIAVSVPLAYRLLRQRGHLEASLAELKIPARELYGFSVPLLSSDLVLVLRGALVPILLGVLATTIEVAEYRAVFPHARLNLVVLQSFTFLFLPMASRLFARQDSEGLHALYWKSAVWVVLMTFPIFAVTFALAPALVEFLYGARYAASAPILSILALGFFISAALGFAGHTLRALGRVRYVFATDIGTGLLSVAAYIVMIPPLGALGAAIGAAATIGLQVVLYQWGLHRVTGISLLDRRYVGVYASLIAAAGGLLLMQLLVSPPLWLSLPIAGGVSLILVRLHRGTLDIISTFPELQRVPLIGRFLSIPNHT